MPAKFKKGIDLSGQRAIGASDPTAATDLATKQYVDNTSAGLNWKQRVRAASTANVTVASALVNGLSMDGVTLATGDRVLLKNQTTASENGIYIVVASGAAPRATDADTSAEVRNMIVGVESGTVAADTIWQLITDNPTLGTTSLSFTQFSGGAGAAYATVQAAGSPLTQRSVLNFGTGLTAVDNSGSTRTDVTVDTSVVARKFAADCVVTTNPQTFTHGLGSDVEVAVWESNERVYPDITKTATSGGQAIIDWGGAPTAAQYRVVVIG